MSEICNACGLPITGADYDDRHTGHEADCPNRDYATGGVDCDCDLVYHATCCPDCMELEADNE